jgi:hypothetical protein
MRIKKIFFCAVLVLLMGGAPGYAVDQSLCRDGSDVFLNDNGTLLSCTLRDEYGANGIACESDRQITFYNNGALQSCILAEQTTINGITCEADWTITFYRDGNLATCVKDSGY